jgi:primosomal replication protein N
MSSLVLVGQQVMPAKLSTSLAGLHHRHSFVEHCFIENAADMNQQAYVTTLNS